MVKILSKEHKKLMSDGRKAKYQKRVDEANVDVKDWKFEKYSYKQLKKIGELYKIKPRCIKKDMVGCQYLIGKAMLKEWGGCHGNPSEYCTKNRMKMNLYTDRFAKYNMNDRDMEVVRIKPKVSEFKIIRKSKKK